MEFKDADLHDAQSDDDVSRRHSNTKGHIIGDKFKARHALDGISGHAINRNNGQTGPGKAPS